MGQVVKWIEQYMVLHQFLEADKKKVRDFLRVNRVMDAYLTRTDLHFFLVAFPALSFAPNWDCKIILCSTDPQGRWP